MSGHRMTDDARCPDCNALLNDATGIADDQAWPVAGDLAVCAYCCAMLKFIDDVGHVERLSKAEYEALAQAERDGLDLAWRRAVTWR